MCCVIFLASAKHINCVIKTRIRVGVDFFAVPPSKALSTGFEDLCGGWPELLSLEICLFTRCLHELCRAKRWLGRRSAGMGAANWQSSC